jgi:hypothetical protein
VGLFAKLAYHTPVSTRRLNAADERLEYDESNATTDRPLEAAGWFGC